MFPKKRTTTDEVVAESEESSEEEEETAEVEQIEDSIDVEDILMHLLKVKIFQKISK